MNIKHKTAAKQRFQLQIFVIYLCVFLGLGAVLVLHNSPPFYHFLASFLFNSQVSCDNLYTRDINATFSSKTPYQYNAIINNESEFSGCTAKKIYTVFRHGARFPSEKHIKEFNAIMSNFANLKNLTDTASELAKWTDPFPYDEGAEMSETGLKELYCLARRFHKRFPDLFVSHYSTTSYSFAATFKERTIRSALSFAHGLFEGTGPLNGYQPVQVDVGCDSGDKLLRFFDECPYYDEHIHHNKTLKEFIDEFLNTDSFRNVQSEVQSKIDPSGENWNVTAREVITMYDICCAELANYDQKMWCLLFSSSSLDILEYYRDLKVYWTKGYGNSLNWRISCPLLGDIISTLTSSSTKTLVTAKFAHAETLIPLVCALGLHKDDQPLTPSTYQAQRKFRVSKISPFAGNIAFVVYTCDNDGSTSDFVRILLNEEPVSINHDLCSNDKEMCPLEKLTDIIKDISDNLINYPCDLAQFCGTKPN